MLHAVIMAGGSGTRFWPASRTSRPKQFLSLASDRSLLRLTYERVAPLIPPERIWVVTASATVGTTRELLPELAEGNVLGEPEGRDTAACVGYAAQVLRHKDADACCVVLPADHIITDEEVFRASLSAAARLVTDDGGLLTFGLRPSSPETGFGYLQLGARHRDVDGLAVHRLERFVEKPDLETARRYLQDSDFLWNSGMFVWKAADLLAEIEAQLPVLAKGLSKIAGALGTEAEAETISEIYPTLPRISVDYGIMEGARRRWCLPVDYGWSDVGSWPALRDVAELDEAGNVSQGRVVLHEVRDSVVISDGPVVAAVGVEGLVIVATGDAVLVVPAAQAQAVKEVVSELRSRNWDDVV